MRTYLRVFLFILLSSVLPMQAQRNCLKQVTLTLNSKNGVYAKGDTVRVYGSLAEPFDTPLTLSIYDGGTHYYSDSNDSPFSTPIILTAEPRVIYQQIFQEPKAIMLSVSDGQKRSMVGFMVSPEKFRPGYAIPDDFMSYWDNQKAKLRQSEPQVTLKPVELKDANDAAHYDVYSIEISMPEGNPARGFIAKPKGADAKSLPIAFLVHAAGVSGDWCHASPSNVLRYAKKGHGVIAIDINAHGYPEDRPQQYYIDLENGELKDYSTRPLTDRDSFYFRLMFLRDIRALDYVCTLPEWDGKRVLVYGESQGGAQAEALAGLDSRVSAVVANVPAMTDFGAFLQKRQSGWPGSYQKDVDSELGRSILPYFDGALFLQFSKAKLFIVSGSIDETCPAAGVHAAYNAAKSRDKQIYPFPYRWHSGTNEPYDNEWYGTIGNAREEFVNNYLK